MNSVTTDAGQAALMAQSEMARIAARYSLTLAFDETFRLMAWLFLAALIMAPFCRPASNAAVTAPVEAH
jgi:DHA2 family multidrug resistance protein